LDEDLDLSTFEWSKIKEMWSYIKFNQPHISKLISSTSPCKASSSSHLEMHSLEEVVGYEVFPSSWGGGRLVQNFMEAKKLKDSILYLANDYDPNSSQSLDSLRDGSNDGLK
jgi:hypothetical protein